MVSVHKEKVDDSFKKLNYVSLPLLNDDIFFWIFLATSLIVRYCFAFVLHKKLMQHSHIRFSYFLVNPNEPLDNRNRIIFTNELTSLLALD